MKIKNLNQKPENQNLKPDEDDNLCWSDIVKGVRKIKDPNRDLSKPEPKPIEIRESVNIFAAYHGEGLQKLSAGSVDNIDYQTARRFKRGEFRIEGILDLHGVTSDRAFDLVLSFVHKSYLHGKRCIQIVTGKGLHQESEDWFSARGVLKDLVPQWLNSDQIRPLLLAFDYSRPEDGGDGALTILLRRQTA